MILFTHIIHRRAHRERRGLSLAKRILCVVLCYTVFFSSIGFEQLAQASIDYSSLSRDNWGTVNTDIHYRYDDNGSLTEKITADKDEPNPDDNFIDKTVYTYNLQNRLKEVRTTADGADWDITTYKYNDDGIRIEKNHNGTVTKYLLDSHNHTGFSQVLEERTNDALTKTYIIGDDIIGQADNTGDITYLLYDGQGSVRHHSDSNGSLVAYSGCDTFAYDAYGQRVDPLKDTINEGLFYTGEQFDSETGQYYLRARYYNPLNGLFNQMDDFSGNNADPQSLHKYLYAYNNPVNNIDPSGKFIGGIVELSNYINCRAFMMWMSYGGAVLNALNHAVYITAGLFVASSISLVLIEWGYLPKDMQAYMEAIQYYSGVGFVMSVVALGLLSTLPDPRVRPRPAQNVPRLACDKEVDGKPAPRQLPTSRPIAQNAAMNAEKDRDVSRLYQQGALEVRVNQRQIQCAGNGNFVQKGLNRPDTQGIFSNRPNVRIEYDTRLNELLLHRDRILANDPESVVILKWFAPNGEYTIIP